MMKSSHRSSDNKANYVPYIIVFGIDMTRVFFNTLLFSIGMQTKQSEETKAPITDYFADNFDLHYHFKLT
jgi:hypothetical protein